MFKFEVHKTYYLGFTPKLLEKFSSKDIHKGLKKVLDRCQWYINVGEVNDYTTFSCGVLVTKGNRYQVYRRSYFDQATDQFKSRIQLEYLGKAITQ